MAWLYALEIKRGIISQGMWLRLNLAKKRKRRSNFFLAA